MRFNSDSGNSISFLLKHQFHILRADFDPVTGFELTFEQTQGKRIEYSFLHSAFERARADPAGSIFAPLIFVAGRRVVKTRPN